MKKLLYILSVIGLFSCVDDEGNYDYIKVNEIAINEINAEGDTLEGIERRNVISQIDTIRINLGIEGSINQSGLDHYDFEWYICSGMHKHTVIGREKDLVYPVDLQPGQYTLFFQVTDKSTGLKWLQDAVVTVMTPTTRGFLILGDLEDGTIGLDMVAMPLGKDTVVVEDVFDNSERKFVQAEKLLFAGARYGDVEKQALWMTTQGGTYRLSNQTEIEYMAEATEYGLIETEYEYKKPIRIMDMFPHQARSNRSSMYRGYITEDLVVFNMIIQTEYFTTPVNRYSSGSATFFKPYPLAFCNGIGSGAYNCVLLYDMDNDRFVRISGTFNVTNCVELNDYMADPFPWNQEKVDRTIVYGENSYDGSYGSSYAIMKDTENKYFIYKFSLISTYSIQKNGLYPVDLSLAIDFDKASHYAFAANQTRIMYSVGSKLYMYDYSRQQIAVRDFGVEITYLETDYVSNLRKDEFLMATYDSAEKGMIRKLEVGADPNVTEMIDRPAEVWKTRLKVKDMEWKYTP